MAPRVAVQRISLARNGLFPNAPQSLGRLRALGRRLWRKFDSHVARSRARLRLERKTEGDAFADRPHSRMSRWLVAGTRSMDRSSRCRVTGQSSATQYPADVEMAAGTTESLAAR